MPVAALTITPLSSVSFLVVDDETTTLDLLEGMLRAGGAKAVFVATSVAKAVETLLANKIDCILCDHRMEGFTGLAFLQRVRAGRNNLIARDTRFILVTAYASGPVVNTAKLLDVDGFVTKPFTADVVMKAIQLAFATDHFLKSPAFYAKTELPRDDVA
ncbi:MAG: response regulator [Candidatus Binataceae bacterium]